MLTPLHCTWGGGGETHSVLRQGGAPFPWLRDLEVVLGVVRGAAARPICNPFVLLLLA